MLAYDADPDENFWVPGNFIFEESNSVPDQRLENIGLRVRGNSSRNRPEGDSGKLHNPENPKWRQSSFALWFDKYVDDLRFEELDRLDLRYIREDPMRIREVYCFNLYYLAEVYTSPLISMCRFYIKVVGGASDPGYFGIFKMREHVEKDYLAARQTIFGDNNPGDKRAFLWKADFGASLGNYDPAVVDSPIYELQTGTSHSAEALEQLTDFIKNLVTLEGDELKAWANETIDVPVLMKTYLINVICGNQDDYWFNANNYNFYFNTHGKFYFIPNDFDPVLGCGWTGDIGRKNLYHWGVESNPLIEKLLNITEFRQMYKDAFIELTDTETGLFHVSKSIPRIEKWQSLINDYIWDDTIHMACDKPDAGCVLPPKGQNLQTPYEDSVAYWASPENKPYKLLETGENNYFEVSGSPARAEDSK
ncbi:CotH kinase family protein [Dysgonomonas capnocytophagoides]|uniref:CotH kinase family protein n=1 Tax=Dysgonomonas capnocytophagoides TaxID=45254 RepID=UPI0029218906|nr:hypothetical protein DCPSUM001_17430 [Dysgonomonas capnocytophagoides]